MKTLAFVMALAFAGGIAAGAALAAAEQTITQKGKQFSESEVTIKRGDTLLFVNDDIVAHNILSMSPGNEFNLGSQPPGASTPVTFDKDGQIFVICAIHPLMKLKVQVTD